MKPSLFKKCGTMCKFICDTYYVSLKIGIAMRAMTPPTRDLIVTYLITPKYLHVPPRLNQALNSVRLTFYKQTLTKFSFIRNFGRK